ncbi:MAG: ribonuclease M5 [Lactococcus hircilactis]|uniref:ribonuclease M5 n=1 Tax=Lactococcus hircilactis TaxID=1494462 RepID=UPI003BE83CF1
MEKKKKITKVIVVEGRDDTAQLKRFFDVDTYETNGSSINAQDLERLKKIHTKRGIIVFTDPDFQGERIRKMIMQAIPTAEHAFIQRDEGIPKSKSKGHSLGVEHADFSALTAALNHVETSSVLTEQAFALTQSDLIRLGLIMRQDSRKRREVLCFELRIGYANGKQLLKRLNMFGISLEAIENVMKKYEKESETWKIKQKF